MKKVTRRASIVPGGRHINSPESIEYHDKHGWKIHLTVKPQNYDAVDIWLDRNHPGQYKLLAGGDAGEKDFTVYVGRKDDTIRLARRMLQEIGHLLERNNAGGEDIKIHEKIAMRFDPRGNRIRYVGRPGWDGHTGVYYGKNGIPYDRRAMDILGQINMQLRAKERNGQRYPSGQLYTFDPKQLEYWEKELLKHEEIIKNDLEKQFGSRFTGSGNEVLRKKKSIKPKTKRKICRCKK
jgi:hypothetical protein